MLPTLIDLTFICSVMAAGLAAGWIIASIAYSSALRRLKIETWRAASAHYARRYSDLIRKL